MKRYVPRIMDKLLADAVESKGAVLVEGPAFCGKTTTALRLAKSAVYMDDPVMKDRYVDLFYLSPANILDGRVPHLINEWQNLLKIWDAVRQEVDLRGEFGQFIMTGSSVPADPSQLLHTGAGRIKKLRMGTMTLYESGESSGEVSLSGLFDTPGTVSGRNNLTSEDLARLICRGGWPASLKEAVPGKYARGVFDFVTESGISRADGVSRCPARAREVMKAYSRGICTQAKYAGMRREVMEAERSKVRKDTVNSYIAALKAIFIIDEIPVWTPGIRTKALVRNTPVRNFCDPSLAAAALGLEPGTLVSDEETFERLFKSICLRDLKAYAQSLGGEMLSYKDSDGVTCDAVICLPDGRWGAVEIRLFSEETEGAVKRLKRFVKTVNTDAMKEPSFLMVMSGTDRFGYRRPDGVYVVPAGCLKY